MEEKPTVRQRVNVAQTSKGLHQVEATYEVTSQDGIDADLIAKQMLEQIKLVEEQLKEDNRKLVIDEK